MNYADIIAVLEWEEKCEAENQDKRRISNDILGNNTNNISSNSRYINKCE